MDRRWIVVLTFVFVVFVAAGARALDFPTISPTVPTSCPPSDTQCPVITTQCPVTPTNCPFIDSLSTTVATECPAPVAPAMSVM